MFIWVGIDVDCQLTEIKEVAKTIEDELVFEHSNFTLPFHISLKISFEVNDDISQNVINDLMKIYEEVEPFEIPVKGIEYENTITWIRMQENDALMDLSQKINQFMLDKYAVPLHEYDLDYKFHTTLFMDDDSEKVRRAYEKIKDMKLPTTLKAEKFLIGLSDTGKLGSFGTYKEVSKVG